MPGGESVTGTGPSAKAAENDAALAGCRLLEQSGLLQRQVSAKQKSKGGKGKKKGKGQVGADAHPNAWPVTHEVLDVLEQFLKLVRTFRYAFRIVSETALKHPRPHR